LHRSSRLGRALVVVSAIDVSALGSVVDESTTEVTASRRHDTTTMATKSLRTEAA
jgi:hypothetical protein